MPPLHVLADIVARRRQFVKAVLLRAVTVGGIQQRRLNHPALERNKTHVVAAHHHEIDVLRRVQIVFAQHLTGHNGDRARDGKNADGGTFQLNEAL